MARYRGGESGHFWPKLAGWFLVPAASSVATLVLSPLVLGKKVDPNALTAADRQTIGTLSAVCHALGAAGSWYVSGHYFENSIGTQAFFRGGMWSEMVSTLFAGGSLAMSDAPGVAPPAKPAVVSGIGGNLAARLGDPKAHLANVVSLLSGGAIPAPPKQDVRQLVASR
jgi:hypothetical protein